MYCGCSWLVIDSSILPWSALLLGSGFRTFCWGLRLCLCLLLVSLLCVVWMRALFSPRFSSDFPSYSRSCRWNLPLFQERSLSWCCHRLSFYLLLSSCSWAVLSMNLGVCLLFASSWIHLLPFLSSSHAHGPSSEGVNLPNGPLVTWATACLHTHGLKHTIQCHTCSQQSRKKNIQRPLAYHRALFLMGPCRQARGMCTWVWRLEPNKCHAQHKKPGKKLKNLNVSKAEGWRRNCGQKMRGENRAKGNTPGLRQQVGTGRGNPSQIPRCCQASHLYVWCDENACRPELPKSPCKDWQGMSPLYKRTPVRDAATNSMKTRGPSLKVYTLCSCSVSLLESAWLCFKVFTATSKLQKLPRQTMAKLPSQSWTPNTGSGHGRAKVTWKGHAAWRRDRQCPLPARCIAMAKALEPWDRRGKDFPSTASRQQVTAPMLLLQAVSGPSCRCALKMPWRKGPLRPDTMVMKMVLHQTPHVQTCLLLFPRLLLFTQRHQLHFNPLNEEGANIILGHLARQADSGRVAMRHDHFSEEIRHHLSRYMENPRQNKRWSIIKIYIIPWFIEFYDTSQLPHNHLPCLIEFWRIKIKLSSRHWAITV